MIIKPSKYQRKKLNIKEDRKKNDKKNKYLQINSKTASKMSNRSLNSESNDISNLKSENNSIGFLRKIKNNLSHSKCLMLEVVDKDLIEKKKFQIQKSKKQKNYDSPKIQYKSTPITEVAHSINFKNNLQKMIANEPIKEEKKYGKKNIKNEVILQNYKTEIDHTETTTNPSLLGNEKSVIKKKILISDPIYDLASHSFRISKNLNNQETKVESLIESNIQKIPPKNDLAPLQKESNIFQSSPDPHDELKNEFHKTITAFFKDKKENQDLKIEKEEMINQNCSEIKSNELMKNENTNDLIHPIEENNNGNSKPFHYMFPVKEENKNMKTSEEVIPNKSENAKLLFQKKVNLLILNNKEKVSKDSTKSINFPSDISCIEPTSKTNSVISIKNNPFVQQKVDSSIGNTNSFNGISMSSPKLNNLPSINYVKII